MKKQDVAGRPSRVRARGMTYADGDVNSLNGSLTDHARTRKARRRPFTEAEVAAWRQRIFAETMEDPVKVAVEEAVKFAVKAASIAVTRPGAQASVPRRAEVVL